MNKDNWVAMFRDIGLNEETMGQWHQLFERRHPEDHQAFLEWLNIPAEEIKAIRSN